MPDHESRERPGSATAIILVCVFSAVSIVFRLNPALHLFPVIANFTPLGALSLFAGSRVRGWKAYLVPMTVMILSDLGLSWMLGKAPFDLFVYATFLLVVALGSFELRKVTLPRVLGGAVSASLLFFVLVNFGCWLSMTDYYDRSVAGLATCYAMAVPFSWQMLVADLVFTPVFFGVYVLATARDAALAKEPA